ncbi:uncharacterized protein [Parasteatoda tepidariorum]|uniref:uncharacterized protein n=1 Tax=Parasteatoda tepidariorum TaxID=114398 RepID=UPI00077FD37B|nr:uncharacterized protein LOC107455922 [Parasteatoda tepidariorum]
MDNAGELDRPDLAAETSFDVLLYIYDLSKELAKSFKKILKGKPLPGIWHTGLVAYGREYYFCSTGIESCRPGETILGEPDQILTLGKTELPYSVFLEYIFALGESTYRPGSYHLLEHNCNTFSQEVCQFVIGCSIPSEIRELPQEISQNKNLSSALKEYFHKLSLRAEGSRGISFGLTGRVAEEQRNGHSNPEPKPHNGARRKKSNAMSSSKQDQSTSGQQPMVNGKQTEAAEGSSQKSQKSQKQESPSQQAQTPTEVPKQPETVEAVPNNANDSQSNGSATSEAQSGNQANDAASNESAARRLDDEEEDGAVSAFNPRRSRRYEDPPITFPDVDGPGLLKRLLEIMDGKLNPQEVKDFHEIMEYLTTEGGAWALGTTHLEAIGRLLNDRTLPPDVPILCLKVMQAASLKEDVILLLHQDREKHYLMSYFNRVEFLPVEEQTETCGLLCNLCSNPSSYDWLTYISEWDEEGKPCNNSRVTVRVAVHGLLAEKPETRERGCALVYNLALKKELFDDIATELAMAVLQFLQEQVPEELLFQSLTALLRFMFISYNEIPALMKMLGPDVDAFRGASKRIDPIIEEIQMKLKVSRA